MKHNTFLIPIAFLAAAATLSACSSRTESVETADLFAPAAEVVVPAPVETTALDVQTLQAPPAIEQIIQAPAFGQDIAMFQQPQVIQQPQFIEQPQVIQQPQFIEQPIIQQEVIAAPQPVVIQAPALPTISAAAPSYDCSVIPSSKAGLAEYRANCLRG